MILKIAVLGGLTIDKNEYGGRTYEKIGGPIHYISRILATFNCEIYLYTVLGIGFPTDYLEKLCNTPHIHCSFHNFRSPHIVFKNIYDEKGSREQYVFGGLTKISVDEIVDDLRHVDYLIISPVLNEFDSTELRKLVDVSKVAVDLQGFLRRVYKNLVISDKFVSVEDFRGIELIKFSVEEAPHILADKEYLDRFIDVSRRYLCITLGYKGCILFTKERIIYIPSYKVEEIRDPTGVGDVFLAGLVYADLLGMSPLKSASFAAATASLFLGDELISFQKIVDRMGVVMNNSIDLEENTIKNFYFNNILF